MQIKDLKANPKNPRKISAEKLDMLKASVLELGDLSGFVYNRRSKKLVSGHQKTKVIPPKSKIVLEVEHPKPTACRTVAEGYVLVGDERFKYREVDADEEWEATAMLAANKHSGDWDNDLLKVVLSDVKSLGLTGFTPIEIKALKIELPQLKPLDEEEETDEEYVRNTPETTEQIDTENFPSMVNEESASESSGQDAFDSIDETTEVKGKRYVIIVDCKDQEMKDKLRETLLPLVEQAGAKIF